MLLRYTKFEKITGIFVALTLVALLALWIGMVLEKGWLQPKLSFYTLLESAEGVRKGTSVEMKGIRIGAVTFIALNEQNKIVVRFSVYRKFQDQIRGDTKVHCIRPFIIGDRVLNLTPGSSGLAPLSDGSFIENEDVIGLADLLNGRKLMPYITMLGNTFELLTGVLEAFSKDKKSRLLITTMERLPVFLERLSTMSSEMIQLKRQIDGKGQLKRIVDGMAKTVDELARFVPKMVEGAPDLGKDMQLLVTNLAMLTTEFKKLVPVFAEIAPEIPRSSRRMIEAIDEAVVVLKALQRSFLLKGSAREVREEEALRNDNGTRNPASDKTP